MNNKDTPASEPTPSEDVDTVTEHYAGLMEALPKPLQGMLMLRTESDARVAKAVREEREACAKYIETFFAHWTRSLTLHDVDDLAAAIRGRGDQP